MSKLTRRRERLTPALVLTSALVVASCSQAGPPSPTSQPTVASSSPTTATPSTSAPAITATTSGTIVTQRITISVNGKQVVPAPAMVTLTMGKSMTITVTSDHDDTLHAHGFNIEEPVTAGQPLTVTVKGTLPGVYDVELHDPELRLLQIAVR